MSSHRPDPVVALIVAVALNGVIGKEGALPWRLPSDLKMFRRLTMGKPIIMGRRTYESIGRPLDGRHNIVVSRSVGLAVPGVEVVRSVEAAIAAGRKAAMQADQSEIMVIGGAQIYGDALPLAGRIYWTEVQARPDGDVFMPPLAPGEWHEVSRSGPVQDARDEFACSFIVLEKRVSSG